MKSALAELLESWPENGFRRLDLPETVFGMHHKIGDRTFVLLQTGEALASDFDRCANGLDELGVLYRIADGSGSCVWGLDNPREEAG